MKIFILSQLTYLKTALYYSLCFEHFNDSINYSRSKDTTCCSIRFGQFYFLYRFTLMKPFISKITEFIPRFTRQDLQNVNKKKIYICDKNNSVSKGDVKGRRSRASGLGGHWGALPIVSHTILKLLIFLCFIFVFYILWLKQKQALCFHFALFSPC